MIEFHDRREPKHTHRFDPNDYHAVRPEGECPACDQIWADTRKRNEEQTGGDPFKGLG
jgi:hypothetical protein